MLFALCCRDEDVVFHDYLSQLTFCFDGVSSPISVSDYHRPPHAVLDFDLRFLRYVGKKENQISRAHDHS